MTFDDGYKDHIKFVYPELKKRNLKAFFFPSGITTFENKVLDTNLIQHILAKTNNYNKLYKQVNQLAKEFELTHYEIKKKINLYSKNPNKHSNKPSNRYDNSKIIYIKRLLQFGLSKNVRKKIINYLFKKYVKIPQSKFSKNFYLNKDDINKLLDNEMTIGSHTYNHEWLGSLKKEKQEEEINLSLNFLNYFKIPKQNWIMCYPYGSYNKNTLSILRKKHCLAAFTTKSKIANLKTDNFLELPRKDTNDYPI